MIQVSSNQAFAATAIGLLLICSEFCAPGLVVPGAAGAVLALGGAAVLAQKGPTSTGLALLSVGGVLLLAAIYSSKPSKLRLLASAGFLSAGSAFLLPEPAAISPALCIVLSALTSAVTVALARLARLGRRQKRNLDLLPLF